MTRKIKKWNAQTRLAALRKKLSELQGHVEKHVTRIYEDQILELEKEVAEEKDRIKQLRRQMKENNKHE